MNKKKTGVAFLTAVGMAVAGVFFIWQSNDHQECSTQTSTSTDAMGCVTVTEMHQCQERFSL